MFDFQSDFFKTYEQLNEAKDPFYSKNFWSWAKNNKYNELCFRVAFEDDLKELGINLDELFDEYDMFKEKSSYGIIKKALEEHPENGEGALNLIKLNYKENMPILYYSNIMFYDNQNKIMRGKEHNT